MVPLLNQFEMNIFHIHLCQFDYTITHQIANEILIENFVRWPMNITYYGMKDRRYIHIYPLPWSLNKNDKRQLPVVGVGSDS
ncbi:unnamed protein product [Rotaria sp. Silwood2]|nr:unnamed protein product [Rotaria sp. Silwood2]CAF4154248.1 unnamed protein product [Rotaria sp. Silwood2]CAF4264868.1 unnamed protein product [Rotaria sp. Silwood2]